MSKHGEEPITPVLFRADKHDGTLHITAVFPTQAGTCDALTMGCFEHIGQHSACSLGWYHTTRKATPDEYADLKRELEAQPYGYRLKVYSRMQPWMHKARHEEVRP